MKNINKLFTALGALVTVAAAVAGIVALLEKYLPSRAKKTEYVYTESFGESDGGEQPEQTEE